MCDFIYFDILVEFIFIYPFKRDSDAYKQQFLMQYDVRIFLNDSCHIFLIRYTLLLNENTILLKISQLSDKKIKYLNPLSSLNIYHTLVFL